MSGMDDDYVSLMHQSEELLRLRQDNAALRAALERTTAERNAWRNEALDAKERATRAVHRLHATIKETLV